MLKEFKENKCIDESYTPTVYWKAFKDNSGALELARVHKMRPRTKHINVKYHHFRSHVAKGEIQVEKVATEDQVADLFTKPLPEPLFEKFTQAAMGWSVKKAINKVLSARRGSVGIPTTSSSAKDYSL